jgi:hypothetical protein
MPRGSPIVGVVSHTNARLGLAAAHFSGKIRLSGKRKNCRKTEE